MALTGLHHTLISELGAAIVGGEHAPGDVLRLEDLGERWSVSRTVVREAVRVLQSLHLVQTKRHVGVIVNEIDKWSVYDPQVIRWRLENLETRDAQRRSISQLRMAIEPLAAALAAMHGTPEERQTILDAAVSMAALDPCNGDGDLFNQHDIVFHTTLLRASHNELFAALTPVMREAHELTAPQWGDEYEPDPEGTRLHVEAAQAIMAGDSARAERCLSGMVRTMVFFGPEILDNSGSSDAASSA